MTLLPQANKHHASHSTSSRRATTQRNPRGIAKPQSGESNAGSSSRIGHLLIHGTKSLAEPMNYTVSLNTPVDHHQPDQAGKATVFQPLSWFPTG